MNGLPRSAALMTLRAVHGRIERLTTKDRGIFTQDEKARPESRPVAQKTPREVGWLGGGAKRARSPWAGNQVLGDYFGSSASIAGSNSSIGCAASHMRSKCTLNFAAAPGSRITIRSLSCAFSPLVLKFAEPVRSSSPSILEKY